MNQSFAQYGKEWVGEMARERGHKYLWKKGEGEP